jgi:hypothetical protein
LPPIAYNLWHHVAVTFHKPQPVNPGDPSFEIKMYVDGALLGQQSGAPPGGVGNIANTLDLLIGGTRLNIPGAASVGEIALDEVELFDRALAQSEIQAIFNAGPAGKCRCVLPPSGMVSWWPGDNHPNDILNGHNGTLVNGATYDPSGMVRQAFKFTLLGPPASQAFTGQYVNVPTDPSLDLTQVTVDAWIKTTFLPPPLAVPGGGQTNAVVFIVDKSGPQGLDGYQLFYYGQDPSPPNPSVIGRVQFLVRAGGPSSSTSKGIDWDLASGFTNVADNNWHHIAGTYDGQEIKVYVDGQLQGTTAYTGGITYTNPAPGPLSIGRRECNCPNGYYEGLIDEVEIFDHALTQPEIQAIYNAGSAGKCKGIPVPAGPNFFGFPICPPAPTAPVLSNTPASAQPLFVSTTATNALAGLAFNAFAGPVDIYEALVTPLSPPFDLFIYDGTVLPPPGRYTIGPWPVPPSLRANSAASVNMTTPANGLFFVPLPLQVNPPGPIALTFYEVVVPANTNMLTFNFATSDHYTWCNTKTLP